MMQNKNTRLVIRGGCYGTSSLFRQLVNSTKINKLIKRLTGMSVYSEVLGKADLTYFTDNGS